MADFIIVYNVHLEELTNYAGISEKIKWIMEHLYDFP